MIFLFVKYGATNYLQVNLTGGKDKPKLGVNRRLPE
jgi:hypothetical protein